MGTSPFTFGPLIQQSDFISSGYLIALGVAQSAPIFPIVSASNLLDHWPFYLRLFSLVLPCPVYFRQFRTFGVFLVPEWVFVSSKSFFKCVTSSSNIHFVVSGSCSYISLVYHIWYLALSIKGAWVLNTAVARGCVIGACISPDSSIVGSYLALDIVEAAVW